MKTKDTCQQKLLTLESWWWKEQEWWSMLLLIHRQLVPSWLRSVAYP